MAIIFKIIVLEQCKPQSPGSILKDSVILKVEKVNGINPQATMIVKTTCWVHKQLCMFGKRTARFDGKKAKS